MSMTVLHSPSDLKQGSPLFGLLFYRRKGVHRLTRLKEVQKCVSVYIVSFFLVKGNSLIVHFDEHHRFVTLFFKER
ncbi:hypothetical protein M2444_004693 [Paenibacillus sp. PastF-3]|nr:hypothetical protein [Paenibacillus sp. PastF-3]